MDLGPIHPMEELQIKNCSKGIKYDLFNCIQMAQVCNSVRHGHVQNMIRQKYSITDTNVLGKLSYTFTKYRTGW